MHPEHTKLEKSAAIIIGLSLIGYIVLKAGPLKITFDILLAVSVLFYMLSKTTRFWKYITSSTQIGWLILIVTFILGNILPFWLETRTWGILAVASIAAFTISVNNSYKNRVVNQKTGL